jgi:hypothetical protein
MYNTKTTYSGSTTNGSQAFGHSSTSQNASDYILNKKTNLITCKSKMCLPKTPTINQSNYLLLKKTNYIRYSNATNPLGSSKNYLASGLTTTIDLLNVPVIQTTAGESPTPISTSSIPYLTYLIDPSGVMFGNSICGLNDINNFRIINS